MEKYGNCEVCGFELVAADLFEEQEYDKYNMPTGRVRLSVGYLVCLNCGKKYVVDDTFDGPWHEKKS